MKTILIAGILILGACGGDGGGDFGDPIDSPQAQAAATATLDDTNSLNEIRDDPSDDGSLGKALSISGSLQTMSSAKLGAGAQALTSGLEVNVDENCFTSTDTSVTYTNCMSDSTTIDGTISWTVDTLVIDLTIATTDLTYSIDGDLTITDTLIDGNLDYTWQGMQAGQTFNYSLDADYDNITLDATGCATGGELVVHSVTTGFDVWVKAEYGPNCGDVTIR